MEMINDLKRLKTRLAEFENEASNFLPEPLRNVGYDLTKKQKSL